MMYIKLVALGVALFVLSCNPKESPSSLHYEFTGSGDTTLAFVHGWAINSTYWQAQVEHFSARYKVLTIDLQGHGRSAMVDTAITTEEYATDVVNLLSSLNLKNIVLIGHSMSGNINMHVYDKMRDDVIGFIGIDNLQTVGWNPSDEEARNISTFFRALRNNYTYSARRFSLNTLFAPETDTLVKSRVINDVLALEPAFSVATLESITSQGAEEQRILPSFQIPVLLIVAEGSITDESSLRQYCGHGYKVWTYKGAGHYPMIEIPDAFNMLLLEALETI